MKRVILSLLAATAMTAAASAADLPSRHRAPAAYIPPVFTWTGFYAGLNAGAAFNGGSEKDVNYYLSNVALNYGNDWFNHRRKSDKAGFTGGVQAGYNYQMGSVVLGVEADFNYAGISKKYNAYDNRTVSGDIIDEVAGRSRTQWYGTLRPRIGFTPIDRLLVFATGGLAYGQVKTSLAYADYSTGYAFGGAKSETRFGWTLGAGLEYAVTDHVTVRGEYAYVDLGSKNRYVPGVFAGEGISWKEDASFHVVRAGVNYKF